jgi:F-type H+-transporting ATPase subunit b
MEAIKEGLLKVDPGLFLWTIITFSVLLLILWKAAWKPIVQALDSRAEKIRGDIDNTEKARFEAEKLLSEYKELIANSKAESAQLIARGKEEAEKIKNEIIEKAAKEAGDITERTKKDIEAAKDRALAEIKTEIVTFSTEIAAKILKKNINSDDQKAIAEEVFNKMRTVQ